MKTVKLIIEDEVNVKFTGLDLITRKHCSNALKYFIPGARYSSSFRLGRWDGTKSFMTIGGRTHLNLIDKVLPIIQDAGYEIEIEDLRQPFNINLSVIDENYYNGKVWPFGHRFAGNPIILRDYQVNLINECVTNLQSIVISPTASGKTIITSTLSQLVDYYGRSIIIVPNRNLVLQTEEDYINVGLDVGVIYGDRKEYTHKHTICTWQSLNVLDKKNKDALDDGQLAEFLDQQFAIIADECHTVKATILFGLLTTVFSKIPIRWGLTGTLPELDQDKLCLLSSIGPVVGTLTAKELQNQGHLANCHVNIIQTQDAIAFPNYQDELKYITTDPKRLQWLATQIREISLSGNIFVLLDRIETGEKLLELLPEATFISGKMKTSVRKEQYKEINLADNSITLATYGTSSVGISVNRIFNLMLIEPGKSFVRTIQSIGRGLRMADDKDSVQIWDITSKCKYSSRHLTARKKFYKDSQYPNSITKITY